MFNLFSFHYESCVDYLSEKLTLNTISVVGLMIKQGVQLLNLSINSYILFHQIRFKIVRQYYYSFNHKRLISWFKVTSTIEATEILQVALRCIQFIQCLTVHSLYMYWKL